MARKLDPHTWITWRVSGGGCAIRRDVYDAIGGWDAGVMAFGSDVSLTLRAWCAGYNIVFLSDAEIGHRFRRNFRPGMLPRWAELFHNQFRLLASIGNEADKQERHQILQAKNKTAYTQAMELFESNPLPLPVIQQTRTLEDYWQETEQANTTSIPADTGGGELEPAAIEHVRQHAIGRCLEFGTGTGTSCKAMLQSEQATVVVSVEDVPKWTVKANEQIQDRRVMFVVLKRAANGFYDVGPLVQLGLQFDFVLIDGPPGTQARANAFPVVIPLLAAGAVVLVDDGKRDYANIQRWKQQFGVRAELLPSHRGLYKITTETGQHPGSLTNE